MREVEPDLVAIRAKGDRESNSESAEVRFQRREIEETKAISVAMQSELPQSRIESGKGACQVGVGLGLVSTMLWKVNTKCQDSPRRHVST